MVNQSQNKNPVGEFQSIEWNRINSQADQIYCEYHFIYA